MKYIRPIIIALILLTIWQGVIWLSDIPSFLLPTPMATFKQLLAAHQLLWHHFSITLLETIIGFILGVLFGALTAITLTLSKHLTRWFLPILLISQAIPTFAIAPLLVLWLGFGLSSKIVIVILMIYFPVTSAFYDGLRTTPKAFMDLANVSHSNWLNTLIQIKIPAALPKLASGIRVAAVIAPIGAIIGEWVGSSAGLGFLMLTANARMETDTVFACVFLLIVLSMCLYFMIDHLLSRLVFWG